MYLKLLKFPVKGITFIFLMGFLFSSCSHDPQFIDELDPVCFNTEVLPVLQTSCGTAQCHAYPGEETSFSTQNYNSVMQIVKAGDARNSEMYKVITRLYGENMMPPDQPLSKEQRNIIMVWIEQGAENTVCNSDSDTTVVTQQPVNSQNDSVCFKQTIQPLIVSSCATTGCHDAVTAREGYAFTDYNSIKKAVRPFQPDASKLYRVLFEGGEDRMPPSPNEPLTTAQKELIHTWIAEGALNSDCPDAACDTSGQISFSNDIFTVINIACVGCHNGNTTNGGVNLSDYNNIKNVASTTVNGTSLLTGVIKKEPGFVAMPPSGSLDACDIRKIELWIEQGFQNN